jgi:hypothetical protein
VGLVKKMMKWALVEGPVKLFDKPLPPLTTEQGQLIKEFRDGVLTYSTQVQQDPHVSESWKKNIQRFEKAVIERDPRGFLRWDECLPLRAGPTVAPQFWALRRSENWQKKWTRVLEDEPIGHPQPFFLYPKVGANIILHAHHIERFEKFSQKSMSDYGVIVEFGGGYGGLCRLVHKLGFKGKYIIFDLPQQNLLQRFFLKSAKMPVREVGADDPKTNGISIQNDLSHLASYLAEAVSSSKGPSVFIANWSLSECPIALRDEVSRLVIEHCDEFLITFQELFEDINNKEYFVNWANSKGKAFNSVVEQMPLRKPADYYFLGKKR